MKRFAWAFALMLLFGMIVGCGQGVSEEGPSIGLRFVTETDGEGCPISQKESYNTGYTQNHLPDNISRLDFILYDKTGVELLTTQVGVSSTCADDDLYCVVPQAEAYKLFQVPVKQNMSLEIRAYDAQNGLMYTGRAYNIDVAEQANPNTDAVPVDVYMKRSDNMTFAFNCMTVGRMFHTATMLRDGKNILVIGGVSKISESACNFADEEFCTEEQDPATDNCYEDSIQCDLMVASKQVDLFNIETGEFVSMNPLKIPRAGHQAVLLADGRVLITGGSQYLRHLYAKDGRSYLESKLDFIYNSYEVYNPTGQGNVDVNKTMQVKRMLHTLTPLDSPMDAKPYEGTATRFLMAGGYGDGGRLSSLEVVTFNPYDAQTEPSFRLLENTLQVPRTAHTATRFGASGQILIYGGCEVEQADTPAAEIFQSESQPTVLPTDMSGFETWPKLHHHSATAFASNQKVLITGGMARLSSGGVNSFADPGATAIVLDFSSNVATATTMKYARAFHQSAVMPDGRVVIFGGANGDKLTGGVQPLEVFGGASFADLVNDQGLAVRLGATQASDAGLSRIGLSLTELPDGGVLLVGGATPNPGEFSPTRKTILGSAEVYTPAPSAAGE